MTSEELSFVIWYLLNIFGAIFWGGALYTLILDYVRGRKRL